MKSKFFFINVVLSLFLIFPLLFTGCSEKKENKNPLYIAVAAPMTGKDAPTGKSIAQAVQLYLNEINNNGGIMGRPLLLDIYNDQNNKKLAKKVAHKIIEDGRALAVIGHHYSSCSISGGKVYQKYGIPAVTPVSTNINVTPDNGWYFRTVFNDKLQGKFLANYVSKIFHRKNVTIISENLPYGSYLAKVFSGESIRLGKKIKNFWEFNIANENLDARLEEIVSQLKEKNDSSLIFLSMHAPEGAKIIKLMKDKGLTNKVLCPDSFASKTFPDYFNKYPEKQLHLGYYTDGIHVISPLLFDDADEIIQKFKKNYIDTFQEEPGWRSAFAYDATMVVTNAIKNVFIKKSSKKYSDGSEGSPATLKKDRRAIKDYLSNIISINDAIKGVTGYNYFDKIGDSPKTISIGVFKNGKIISALTQLQNIKNIKAVFNLKKALKDEHIIDVDGRYLYKTNVVYTGIKINEISEIDTDNLTCIFDFFVWFRFQNDFNTSNIKFVNQAEKISLTTPVKEIMLDDLKYRRYHVRGRFKIDSGSGDSIFGKYTLPIRFHHEKIQSSNLKLVTDILGMALPNEEMNSNNKANQKILNPSTGWSIFNTIFFQSIVKINNLGHPGISGGIDGNVDFSQFNGEIVIKKVNFTLRGVVPSSVSIFIFIMGLIILIPVVIAEKKASSGTQFLLWIVKGAILIITLLSCETTIINVLSGKVHIFIYQFISKLFDILWWIIPTYLLTCLLEFFMWIPIEKRTGQSVPGIMRKFTNFIIYTASICCIIAFVYDQKITSLLATSGMIAMIIGLAIQINISNIFSGIALNLERPFRIGDWVKIDTMEGRVIDITWRTTRILKTGGSVECIPNAVASESVVRNYYYPQKQIEIYYIVNVPMKYPPDRVKKIIQDALFASEVILQVPMPTVATKSITDLSVEYNISVTLEKYDDRWGARNAVWSSIWEHLHNAGIRPATQNREIHIVEDANKIIEYTTPVSIINQMKIFMPFPPETRQILSEKVIPHKFSSGDKVAEKGDNKESLFIVAEGVLGIFKDGDGEKNIEIGRLGTSSFYGELLTGEPRTTEIRAISDCLIFELTKTELLPFIEKQPDFLKNLSNILVERMKAREYAAANVKKTGNDKQKKKLLEIVLSVFGFKK